MGVRQIYRQHNGIHQTKSINITGQWLYQLFISIINYWLVIRAAHVVFIVFSIGGSKCSVIW